MELFQSLRNPIQTDEVEILQPLFIPAENGPLVNIIPYIPPVDVLRNIILVNKVFHRITFYMMERKILGWNRKSIKPLFGSIKSEEGYGRKVVIHPYVCESLTVRIVRQLKLLRIPSPSFGDYEIVDYAAKRGFENLLRIGLDILSKKNCKPSESILDHSARDLKRSKNGHERFEGICHILLEEFRGHFKITDEVMILLILRLDLKSFQLLDLSRLQIQPRSSPSFNLGRLLTRKCKNQEDIRKRIEIYKMFVSSGYCDHFTLTSFNSTVFFKLDKELLTLILQKPNGDDTYYFDHLRFEESEKIIKEIMKNENIKNDNSILDYILEQQLKKIHDLKERKLVNTLRICSSMIMYVVVNKGMEFLEKYIDSSSSKPVPHYARFDIKLDMNSLFTSNHHQQQQQKDEEEEEVIKKYEEKIKYLMNTGMFFVDEHSIIKFVNHPELFELMIKYSKELSIIRLIEMLEERTNNSMNLYRLIILHWFDREKITNVLISRSRRRKMNSKEENEPFEVLREVLKTKYNRQRNVKESIRTIIKQSISHKANEVEEVVLKIALDEELGILNNKFFKYLFTPSRRVHEKAKLFLRKIVEDIDK